MPLGSFQCEAFKQLHPPCSYTNDVLSTCSAWQRIESSRAGQREGYREGGVGDWGIGMGLRVNVNAVNVNFGLVMYV